MHQLLFNYLPVDWEDGLAIVQLGNVRFSAMREDGIAHDNIAAAREISVVLRMSPVSHVPGGTQNNIVKVCKRPHPLRKSEAKCGSAGAEVRRTPGVR